MTAKERKRDVTAQASTDLVEDLVEKVPACCCNDCLIAVVGGGGGGDSGDGTGAASCRCVGMQGPMTLTYYTELQLELYL